MRSSADRPSEREESRFRNPAMPHTESVVVRYCYSTSEGVLKRFRDNVWRRCGESERQVKSQKSKVKSQKCAGRGRSAPAHRFVPTAVRIGAHFATRNTFDF